MSSFRPKKKSEKDKWISSSYGFFLKSASDRVPRKLRMLPPSRVLAPTHVDSVSNEINEISELPIGGKIAKSRAHYPRETEFWALKFLSRETTTIFPQITVSDFFRKGISALHKSYSVFAY